MVKFVIELSKYILLSNYNNKLYEIFINKYYTFEFKILVYNNLRYN